MRRMTIGLVAVLGAAAAYAQPAPPGATTPPPSPLAPLVDGPSVSDVLAAEGDLPATSYVVGPGDRLRVQLWGLQELTEDLDVNFEGRLFVPRVGVFEAGGETLAGLRRTVEKRLHELYPREQASLTLIKPRTFLVHVTGAVARPGTYPASPTMRVSAVLPRAGGTLPFGSTRRIEVRRRGATLPLVADLLRFTLFGEVDANPPLLDGDTIFVPNQELTAEVRGAVRRPGTYELVGDSTLAELLRLAGGPGPQASRELPLRISSRKTGDHLGVRSVALGQARETPLADGDVVQVPQTADLYRTVVVEGAVVGPPGLADAQRLSRPPEGTAGTDGTPREVSVLVEFVEGDGVRDLLVKAGGLQPWADGRNAYLSRLEASGNKRRIPVDLVAISRGERHDIEVSAGDTLAVPARREQVLVGGAVQRPGLYQLSSDLKARDYISLAGGATRTGDASQARVLSPDGQSRPIKKVDKVQPGDVITVPERRFTSSEWLQVTLLLGNIAVSAAAVGLAAAYH
jgi:polysaccharide export outer membrane protein